MQHPSSMFSNDTIKYAFILTNRIKLYKLSVSRILYYREADGRGCVHRDAALHSVCAERDFSLRSE